jgi:hypothetical protein
MSEDRSSNEPTGPGVNRTGGPLPNRPTGPGANRPGGPNSRWPPYVQFVFVVVLTVLFLLLAVSMRRHHFGAGELYERNHPYNH